VPPSLPLLPAALEVGREEETVEEETVEDEDEEDEEEEEDEEGKVVEEEVEAISALVLLHIVLNMLHRRDLVSFFNP
jgi:hypothetical protein